MVNCDVYNTWHKFQNDTMQKQYLKRWRKNTEKISNGT